MPSFEYRDRAKYIEQCCYDGAARSVFDYHKGRHTCKLHLRRCQDNLPTDTTSWRQVLATHFSNTGYALPTATTTADVGQTDKKPPASEETYANDDQASDFNLVLKNGVAAHDPFKGAFETNSLPSLSQAALHTLGPDFSSQPSSNSPGPAGNLGKNKNIQTKAAHHRRYRRQGRMIVAEPEPLSAGGLDDNESLYDPRNAKKGSMDRVGGIGQYSEGMASIADRTAEMKAMTALVKENKNKALAKAAEETMARMEAEKINYATAPRPSTTSERFDRLLSQRGNIADGPSKKRMQRQWRSVWSARRVPHSRPCRLQKPRSREIPLPSLTRPKPPRSALPPANSSTTISTR
jgi:hypothetical protein